MEPEIHHSIIIIAIIARYQSVSSLIALNMIMKILEIIILYCWANVFEMQTNTKRTSDGREKERERVKMHN